MPVRRTLLTAALALPLATLAPWSALAQSEDDTSGIRDMVLGDPDAPVTVIEYASFTCPHCANFHESVFKDLKRDYIDTGKIRFVYREVYFDKYGLWASMVARCGGEMRYFGIVDRLFGTMREWTQGGDAVIAGNLRKIGLASGLSDDQLDACMNDGDQARALVDWYQQNGTADEINSTPSFIIDGEKFSNMGYDKFAEILDEKLGS